MTPIYLRNMPPPHAEIFGHAEFLALMARWIKPECYLELGIRNGASFSPVLEHCQKAIGVDINMAQYTTVDPKATLYEMTTDAYFASTASLGVEFDMIFIDADHSYEQSLKDFKNSAKHIVEDGFIFLHDTYPRDESLMAENWCGWVYQTALYIKQNMADDFEVITLPFCPGLTIAKKMQRDKQVIFLPPSPIFIGDNL